MTEPTMNEDQNPLTKPKFIISAVVVAILVALAILLALIPKGGGTASPASSPTSTNSANSSPSTSSAGSVCGLPDGDQSKPATTPSDTKWELVGKIAAPTAPKQYGPGKTEASGLRSCFAHSPTGALYAAANVTSLSGAGKAQLVYQHLAVPGPERDAALNNPSPQQNSTVTAQIAGFKIQSYAPDRAVIVIAAKGSNGALIAVPVPLQWYGGDWKVLIPPSGSTGGGQIADLSGYIEWSGV